MINTGCCELMEIFEFTIDTVKKVLENVDTAKEFETAPIEAKEFYKNTWNQGCYYFAFLTSDKLWKENRLCKEN